MKKEECFRTSASREGGIFTRAWLTDEKPLACVQIAHGMKEHSGRYDEFARFLVDNGYSVFANDHAGHGRSDLGHRGTFSMKQGGFDFVVKDMDALTDVMTEKYPDVPVILLGHSMGSILSALYAKRYGRRLSALILMGVPADDPATGMGILLSRAKVALAGRKAPIRICDRLSANVMMKGIENPRTGAEWLSRDTERSDGFVNDPLTHFDFSASSYYEMLEGLKEFAASEWGKAVPELPILIMGGAEDNAGGRGEGPRHAFDNLKAAGHENVTLTLYDGARHELINELNRQEVMKDILAWITKNVPAC